MSLVKTWVLGIFTVQTALSPFLSSGFSFAQSGANGTAGAVSQAGQVASNLLSATSKLPGLYQQNPQMLTMSNLQAQLQTGLLRCQAEALGKTTVVGNARLMNPVEFAKAINDSVKKADASTSKSGDGSKGSKCSCKEFSTASVPEAPSCSVLGVNTVMNPGGGTASTGNQTTIKNNIDAFIANDLKAAKDAEKCYQTVALDPACPEEKVLVEKQKRVFECMMNEIQRSTQQVSSSLQQMLSANQAQYAKMAQFEGEVQTQLSEIDKVLGPDKELSGGSDQFSGLLGIQKRLLQQREELRKEEAELFAEFNNQEREVTNLEATIEAEQMQRVGSCLAQDTSIVKSGCNRPRQQMGPDGKPMAVSTRGGNQQFDRVACSPIDVIKTRIQQSALMNASNNKIQDRDQARVQQGSMAVQQFEAVLNRISIEMGISQPKREGATGALRPNLKSWADIERNSAIMNSLRQLEESNGGRLKRAGIINTLKFSMKACERDSRVWVKAERENGQYRDKLTQLENRRGQLANRLNSNIDKLNQGLALAIDGLSPRQGNHSAVSRSQCASVSPKSQRFGSQFNASSACFKQVAQNLSDLLDGNERSPATQFAIPAGTMKPGFMVPCRGINGCVTALKAARQQQQDQLTAARQIKTKMIQESNQNVDAQLQNFAVGLQSAAVTVRNQFEAMRDALAKLGVKTIPELKIMEGESLTTAKIKGPNGEEIDGPYQAPKNMGAVLSQLAGGLPDPRESGIKAGLEGMQAAIDEKKKAMVEAAKTLRADIAKVVQTMNACTNGLVAGGGGEGRVGTGAIDCNNVASTLNLALGGYSPTDDSLTTLISGLSDALSKSPDDEWSKIYKTTAPEFKSAVISFAANGCLDRAKTLKVRDGKIVNDSSLAK